VILAALIGIAGGFVLAAAAAGRRTESAFPGFAAAHGFDVIVNAGKPEPKIAKLPGVTSATELAFAVNGQPTCDCTHPINGNYLYVGAVPAGGEPPFKLVSGHMPDRSAPDQVLASFTLQQDDGVQLGTVIHVPLFSTSQASADSPGPNGALPRPKGPTVTLHVVGIEASEDEFPSGGAPLYALYATRAFARSVLPRTAPYYQYLVHLRHGVTDLPRFENVINPLQLGSYSNEDDQAASIEAAIHPQAIGWWILAALAALVGVAVVGQALARQSAIESEDFPTMVSLGADRRQLLALGMERNLMVGFAGAAGALAVATALSPFAPLGEARTAETSTGVVFDSPVLLLGALATVAVVFALGLWPALRAARTLRSDDRAVTSRRPSVAVTHLASMGAPPSAMIGVRNALERRKGGAAVPVGSALLGMVLAVIALCGTAVFGASLSHLTATPRLYGDPFQLNLNTNGGPSDPALLRSLEHDNAVNEITAGTGSGEIAVNKVLVGAVSATAIRGPLLFSTVDGQLPRGDGAQIGLGAETMRQAGAHVGSVVHVTLTGPSGATRTALFRVVSQISFPELEGTVGLGTGALFTNTGFEDALLCPAGPGRAACQQRQEGSGILASVVSGPRGRAALNHYLDSYSSIATPAIIPTSLINFGEAVNFPLIFGAMLAVFGAATLTHLLVVSVSRRRREIGLLKVLGFVNRQVASAVVWQATTLALIGIVIGVPLGLVAGRAIWRAFSNNLGVVPVSVVPIWLVGALVAGVIMVANVLAVGPALLATRSKPASLLREQ